MFLISTIVNAVYICVFDHLHHSGSFSCFLLLLLCFCAHSWWIVGDTLECIFVTLMILFSI